MLCGVFAAVAEAINPMKLHSGPIRRRKGLTSKGYPKPRKTRLRPVRLKPRRTAAIRDEAYKAWVRMLVCCARWNPRLIPVVLGPPPNFKTHWGTPGMPPRRETLCSGRIDPHHAGGDRGLGQKASDDTCIPLCRAHHQDIEDVTGVFKGWTKLQLRGWQDAQIAATQAARRAFLHDVDDSAIPW